MNLSLHSNSHKLLAQIDNNFKTVSGIKYWYYYLFISCSKDLMWYYTRAIINTQQIVDTINIDFKFTLININSERKEMNLL